MFYTLVEVATVVLVNDVEDVPELLLLDPTGVSVVLHLLPAGLCHVMEDGLPEKTGELRALLILPLCKNNLFTNPHLYIAVPLKSMMLYQIVSY